MIALLPISMPGGRTVAGALELAVQRVNADPSLLPGLTLKYTYGDSGCSGPKAMTALAHLLAAKISGGHRFGEVDAVLGPYCSVGCEQTGFVTAGGNHAQISYGTHI